MSIIEFLEEPGEVRKRLDRMSRILESMKDADGYVGPRISDTPRSSSNTHHSTVEDTVCRIDEYENAYRDLEEQLEKAVTTVKTALSRISDLEIRAALTKMYLHDMKLTAIASSFGTSASTIKRKLTMGRSLLENSPEYLSWKNEKRRKTA